MAPAFLLSSDTKDLMHGSANVSQQIKENDREMNDLSDSHYWAYRRK